MHSKNVFVGLSGGVDSAVSAALLQRAGYAVTGVFIRIAIEGYPCPAGQDRIDAMRVAAHLDIPFQEIDLSKEYRERVFADALREFSRGRTPNPDALCNREIKFGLFYDWAMRTGADCIATGHYARFLNGELFTGIDEEKDQSYFLWMVPGDHLQNALFPVGGKKKNEVRALARKFGLPNAARKDSQGLCFLGEISLVEMLTRELHPTPGAVLSESGEVIGRHEGAALYTLGQRHGFVLTAHVPHMSAHYVIAKDIGRNILTVAERPLPFGTTTRVELADSNWIGEPPRLDERVNARFRYRAALIEARRTADAVVELAQPQYVAEGQSLVLYAGERCLGGGVINAAQLQ